MSTEMKTYNYPERFAQIATVMADLYRRKNADYGNSFHDTYTKFGIVSALTRLSDKFNRICELGIQHNRQRNNGAVEVVSPQVASEKINDTLIDLAAYSLMLIMEIEQEYLEYEENTPMYS